MANIYKITYPNGKIYVGHDMTDTLTYFGSVNSKIVENDFPDWLEVGFNIHKELLWREDNKDRQYVVSKEIYFIKKLKSNHPSIGYNRWPKSDSKP